MTKRLPGRVVILGGGMAALAAAWRLSEDPTVESITVYQRGWRLGGKGASSRGRNGRIEEHGLHVWLGYYDNAFRVMREVYEALDREATRPSCAIKTWRDAFEPSPGVGLMTRTSTHWSEWNAVFSPNDELPGEPGATADPMTPAHFVMRAQRLVRDFLASLDSTATDVGSITMTTRPTPSAPRPVGSIVLQAIDAAAAVALEATRLATASAPILPGHGQAIAPVIELLTKARDRLAGFVRGGDQRRRMFELLDLVTTCVRGILSDGLLDDPRGFVAINGEEFLDWLARHGAAPETFESPLVRGVYDLSFSYRDGDPDRPAFTAGTGLIMSAKLYFDYKGAIFWKMQAGMGDVVFAPMYEALQARGVQFEFFHDVRSVEADSDGRRVDAIHLARQAQLRDGLDRYEPLQVFSDLPCFPAKPDGSQLADPTLDTQLLETLWGRHDGDEPLTLRQGDDYDTVIFGISLGMIPFVCQDLIDRNDAWRRMTAHVGTVATQAAQLWLDKSEDDIGWRHPGSTLTGYVKPFDTAASMSHLLSVEDWRTDPSPRSVIYLCNTLPEPPPPDHRSTDYPKQQRDRVLGHTEAFLQGAGRELFPQLATPDGFDWDALVGSESTGPLRLNSQFWTANVDPSDRYVQSLPGSDRHRLRPDESGFSNLFLAGDWTDCGLNVGCIESAAVSGLQAANAVLNHDRWAGISGYWEQLEPIG